ncbi:hypothetical protein [Amycolatopsis sp. GM8]|uniref:hypothetical protein n=1 Tax=Amycolatopsis sp. GM8 TaxID=2896530 RepID=UPI001F43729B|nr:hypothetical protein [Amycolatopsis sp. GM8]
MTGLTVALTAVTAAGCSTTGDRHNSASGGELSAAQQQCMAAATAYLGKTGLLPNALPPELTPLSKPPAKGLTITRVGQQSPSSVALGKRLEEIAATVGWTGKSVVYDGSIEDLNRKALDAVNHSDVVAVDGVPEAAVLAPIKAAKDRGVLFILGSETETPESVPGFGATAAGGDLYKKIGELAAYTFMQTTKCQGKTLVVGLADAEALRVEADTMKSVVSQKCVDCSVSYMEVPFTDVGSPSVTNAVVSNLQSDRSRNFVYFTLGDLAIGIEPALKVAGVDVQIGGAIPIPSNLSELKKGENAFWLGVPQGMTASILVDTSLRALESGKPYVGDHYPVPVFTPENITSTDPIPVYPQDYEAEFKKLWLVN